MVMVGAICQGCVTGYKRLYLRNIKKKEPAKLRNVLDVNT